MRIFSKFLIIFFGIFINYGITEPSDTNKTIFSLDSLSFSTPLPSTPSSSVFSDDVTQSSFISLIKYLTSTPSENLIKTKTNKKEEKPKIKEKFSTSLLPSTSHSSTTTSPSTLPTRHPPTTLLSSTLPTTPPPISLPSTHPLILTSVVKNETIVTTLGSHVVLKCAISDIDPSIIHNSANIDDNNNNNNNNINNKQIDDNNFENNNYMNNNIYNNSNNNTDLNNAKRDVYNNKIVNINNNNDDDNNNNNNNNDNNNNDYNKNENFNNNNINENQWKIYFNKGKNARNLTDDDIEVNTERNEVLLHLWKVSPSDFNSSYSCHLANFKGNHWVFKVIYITNKSDSSFSYNFVSTTISPSSSLSLFYSNSFSFFTSPFIFPSFSPSFSSSSSSFSSFSVQTSSTPETNSNIKYNQQTNNDNNNYKISNKNNTNIIKNNSIQMSNNNINNNFDDNKKNSNLNKTTKKISDILETTNHFMPLSYNESPLSPSLDSTKSPFTSFFPLLTSSEHQISFHDNSLNQSLNTFNENLKNGESYRSNETLPPSPERLLRESNNQQTDNKLIIGISFSVVMVIIGLMVILLRKKKNSKKSSYITFGNASFSKDNLPSNDYSMQSPLSLSSNGYTVLA